jgi:hypothetical protein
MATGLGTLLWSLVARDFTWFSLWLLGLSLLIAGLAFRKRSLRGAFVSVFNWVLLAEGVMRGTLMKPLPPENFHANFELIKSLRNREVVLAAPQIEMPTQEFSSNRGKANDSAKRRVGRPAIPVPDANKL